MRAVVLDYCGDWLVEEWLGGGRPLFLRGGIAELALVECLYEECEVGFEGAVDAEIACFGGRHDKKKKFSGRSVEF